MFEHTEDILDERIDGVEERVEVLEDAPAPSGGTPIGDLDAPLPLEYQMGTQFLLAGRQNVVIPRHLDYTVAPVTYQVRDQFGDLHGDAYPGVAVPYDDTNFPGLLSWAFMRRDRFIAVTFDPAMDLEVLDPQVPPAMPHASNASSFIVPDNSPSMGVVDASLIVVQDFGRGDEPILAVVASGAESRRPLREVWGFVQFSLL